MGTIHHETPHDPLIEGHTSQFSGNQGASWSTTGTSSYTIADYYASTDGVEIPQFHKKRRNGEILPYTPFTQVEYSLRESPSEYTLATQGWNKWYRGLGPWIPTQSLVTRAALSGVLSPYHEDLDPSGAVLAAASQIYSQGHDSLTFIAEFRKTVSLFKDLKKRFKELMQLSKVAQNWLEYRYGWRILWYDIVELNKVLSSLDEKRKRFTHRAGSQSNHIATSTHEYKEGTSLTATWSVIDTIHVSTRGNVTADIQPPKFQFNPAITGWELIKFSFIIDWFLDVGTWLEGLSFLVTVEEYTAAGGIYATINRRITPTGYTVYHPTYTWDLDQGSSEANLILTTRTPMTIPLRPFFNVRLDIGKIADLAAIAYGLLKSGAFSRSLRL